MGCLEAIAIAIIALPIWVIYSILKTIRHSAAISKFKGKVHAARTTSVGSKIRTKYDLLNALGDLLEPMYSVGGIEGAVCIYFGPEREILDIQHWVGDSNSVPMPPETILYYARKLGASGIAVAHNHPNACVTPSDQDVLHAAGLISILEGDDVILIDSYVWCGNQFKSVLNTRRFKDLMKPTL